MIAWAFTRLRLLGVCRYLGSVDEVTCPRFLCVFKQTTETTKTNNDDEKSIIISYLCTNDANAGNGRRKWIVW